MPTPCAKKYSTTLPPALRCLPSTVGRGSLIHDERAHLRAAPKLIRFLLGPCDSASLSSPPCFLFFLPPLGAFAVGVAALSLKDVDMGVGACDAGVEPTEPGVVTSCDGSQPGPNSQHAPMKKHTLPGRYEMDDREKTRLCSVVPCFRRAAPPPLVPLM